MKRYYLFIVCLFVIGMSTTLMGHTADFESQWDKTYDRIWIGEAYWANPMEDWRIQDGRLECVIGGGDRNVHLLTHQTNSEHGTLNLSVLCGLLGNGKQPGSVGFRIGIQDEIDDYRARCFYGKGINVGLSRQGRLFIGKEQKQIDLDWEEKTLRLELEGKAKGDGYLLTLRVIDADSNKVLGSVESDDYTDEALAGNIALVQNHTLKAGVKNSDSFWFRDWNVSGSAVETHPEQTFGPILWAMHTLSRGDLKLSAQMPPLGKMDTQLVSLQINKNGDWATIAEEPIHPTACTAIFRVENWNDKEDIPYRLVYNSIDKSGKSKTHYWEGTIQRDPVDRNLVIAGFTGNTDSGFPNREIVRNVGIHDPDVLFFSGDQLYEGVGGYGIYRQPVDRAIVNYLRKWYMLGWAFGDLMRDRVTLCLPDDHDVYQGNIWGNGGNPITMARHDAGGYAMHPEYVNVVHRTQTGHHPDLYDPTPIKQDISVFYGDMVYGRVSFAIIADRMFKSGPRDTVATWEGRPDHVQDPDFDPETVDKPGLKLLGDRQLKFLRDWAADWDGADMKIMVSQTIFCNLANYHGGNQMYLVADLDSNGWPQSGRKRALTEMRKGFAFHLAGDQHLASIVHHGIEEPCDSGFSFCVPSIAAGYPRSWRADGEGRPVKNRPDHNLPNTGDYIDGLGNPIRVYAIGNPEEKNRPGRLKTLHDKASGYGIVRMNKDERTITMECWRLLVDVAHPKEDDQFPGWPKTISMYDNYGREAEAYLPTIKVSGLTDPVVQVINESTNEIVYTVRINGKTFQPKVFADGQYTLIISEPEKGVTKTFKGIESISKDETKNLEVDF